MTKKILIITPKFCPSIGGIEEQVKLLGENFIQKGYKVDILTNKYNSNLKKYENILGLNVFRFSNIFGYILYLLKNKNYKIIISRQYYKNSFILGLLKYFNIIKNKTVICSDSGGEKDEINILKNKLCFLKLYKLYFFFIGQNNYLNCLNKDNINHLNFIFKGKQKYLNKITNIFNGININNYKKNNIKNIKNILFLGRFEKEKGIFETIQSFKKIKNKNIKLNLVGYGDQNIENQIQNLINNDKRIIYHGKKYGTEKEEIINKTDLFIFPTYYPEGQPVVITEMLLKNILIITTNVANNKEIYSNNIIYTKKGDINDLKEKIEFIIQNISNYKYDYSKALKKLDINIITKQLLNLK